MRILGAVLAGGRSIRFGTDKALAMLDGRTLIAHAVTALGQEADSVILCGRCLPKLPWVEDRPAGGLGPLAGLNAALHFASRNGFDAILCAPIDVHPLPAALRLLAGAHCAVLRNQWSIGLWPTTLAPQLDRHLAGGHRSIRSWLEATGAAMVDDEHLGLRNINFASDLPSGSSGP
jgi:molybdopterin-guanine dinucleotide biosynthesis protein A